MRAHASPRAKPMLQGKRTTNGSDVDLLGKEEMECFHSKMQLASFKKKFFFNTDWTG